MPLAVHVFVDAAMPIRYIATRVGEDVLVLLCAGLSKSEAFAALRDALSWDEYLAAVRPELPAALRDLVAAVKADMVEHGRSDVIYLEANHLMFRAG